MYTMSKKKWMKLLINIRWGDPSGCYNHPRRRPDFVVHQSIRPLDLRDFYKMYGEEEFPQEQQRALRKTHPKMADEKFLCRSCWDEMYTDDLRYDEETGQANFTSIPIDMWKKREYKLLEQAVVEHLIVKKK